MMKKLIICAFAILPLLAAPLALADTWKGKNDYYGKRHGTWTKYLGSTKKVLETINYRHGKPHGPAAAFYKSGKKNFTTTYKDGKHHGAYTNYYDNKANSPNSQGNHKDGKSTGKWTAWHENGQKKSITNYFNGKKHGAAQFFYASGNKYYTTVFRNGLLHGAYAGYFDNGDNTQQYQGKYADNQRMGPWTEWHSNGQKKSIANYFNGKKNGPAQEFHLSGQKYWVSNFRLDKHHGPYSEYFDNAGNTRKIQGAYKDNKRQGLWTEWHENGTKISFINYQEGKKHGPAEYYHWVGGDIDYTTNYKDDKQHGPYAKYHWPQPRRDFTPADAIKDTTDKERKLKVKELYGVYKNGKREGKWVKTTQRGEIDKVTHWRNGIQHGAEIAYHSSGRYGGNDRVFRSINYKNGKRHGIYIQHYNNEGNTNWLKGNYKNGNRVGTWVRWYSNGNREWKGEYNNKGQKHGIWQDFDEDSGKAVKVARFANGKLVGTSGKCPNKKDNRCKLVAE